ncbi:MAG: hypothetical protein U0167_05455 [bacterium]
MSEEATASTRNERAFLLAGAALGGVGAAFFVLHPGFVLWRDDLALLLRLHPIYAGAPPGLRALWQRLATTPAAGLSLYAALVLALCGLQWAARRAARHAREAVVVPTVAAGFAIAATALVAGLPVRSTDIFAYLSIGQLTREGLNPWVERPSDHPELSGRGFGAAVAHGSLYGPLATRLFALLDVGGGSVWGFLLAWRAFLALLLALTVWLLHDSARLLGRAPPERMDLLVMLAWSPLLLFEGVWNGHVDAVAACLIALGLRQVLRGRELPGLFLLASVIAVKVSYAVLWPAILARAFLGAPTRRKGILRALVVAGGAALFYAAWLLPDALSWSHWQPLGQVGGWVRNSFASALRTALRPLGLAGIVVPILSATFAVVLALGLRSVADREGFFRRLARDYLLYLLVFGPFFFPWYVMPALPLVAVQGRARLRSVALLLAATSLATPPSGALFDLWRGIPVVLYALRSLPATILFFLPDRGAPRV